MAWALQKTDRKWAQDALKTRFGKATVTIPLFGKSKVVILVVVLVICGAAGLALGLFLPVVADSIGNLPIPGLVKKAEYGKEEGQGFIYKLEPFIVNLADPGHLRFLKIKIDLESRETKQIAEYERRMPHLRDMILTILCSKKAQEILNVQGKEELRQEIKTGINKVLRNSQVKAVYITEFMIQ